MTFSKILGVDRTIELVVVALTAMGTRLRVVAFREVLDVDKMIELVVVFEAGTSDKVDVALDKG